MFLLTPFLATVLPALIAAGGSMIGRHQAKRDIAKQNAYNSPGQQIARLNKAGLPMASSVDMRANQQSALPETSGEGIGRGLSSYVTTQTQLQQLNIAKEQERLLKAEADLKIAEKDYLLQGIGEDQNPTNLSGGLKAERGIKVASEKGQQIANKILEHTEANTPYRLNQENQKIDSEIANIQRTTQLTEKHITGADIQNDINAIIAKYQDRMSNETLTKLRGEISLLNENITGKELDNSFARIRNLIQDVTKFSQMDSINTESFIKSLSYDRYKEEFKNYKEYQEFVETLQARLRDGAPFSPIGDLKALIALVYTSITGLTGAADMNSSTILNHIK